MLAAKHCDNTAVGGRGKIQLSGDLTFFTKCPASNLRAKLMYRHFVCFLIGCILFKMTLDIDKDIAHR